MYRILVADDPDTAESCAILLKGQGFDAYTATTADEAFRLAASIQPHVILVDISMLGLNGADACRRIRDEPWGQQVLVIAITGWSQEDYRKAAIEAGCDDHLLKPVDNAELRIIIASHPKLKKVKK